MSMIAPRDRVLRAETVRALFGPRRRHLALDTKIRDLRLRIVRARRTVARLDEATR